MAERSERAGLGNIERDCTDSRGAVANPKANFEIAFLVRFNRGNVQVEFFCSAHDLKSNFFALALLYDFYEVFIAGYRAVVNL